jgi:hypothetical protein
VAFRQLQEGYYLRDQGLPEPPTAHEDPEAGRAVEDRLLRRVWFSSYVEGDGGHGSQKVNVYK